ncbi:6918_t:CDS:2, partial [Acaulospora morrowiae]
TGTLGQNKSDSCGTANDPCRTVNSSLVQCGGSFRPPLNGSVYNVNDTKLAPCQCNQPFYNNITACLTCYVTPTTNFSIAPLSDYKSECVKHGVSFTAKSPPAALYSSNQGAKVAVTVLIVLFVGLILLMIGGAMCWLCWKKEKLHPKLSDNPFMGGASSSKVSPSKKSKKTPSSVKHPETLSHSVDNQRPPPGSFHSEAPGTLHSSPPPGSFHSEPPPGSFHSEPPPGSFHSEPPPGSFHSEPPPSSFHSEPPVTHSTQLPSITPHEPMYEVRTSPTIYASTTPEYDNSIPIMQMPVPMPTPHSTQGNYPPPVYPQGNPQGNPQGHPQGNPQGHLQGYRQDYRRGQ